MKCITVFFAIAMTTPALPHQSVQGDLDRDAPKRTVIIRQFVDTTIFSESENAGGGTSGIFAGMTNQLTERRALIRPDLSSLPSTVLVLDASLELVVDRAGGLNNDFDVSAHRLSRPWGEGSVNAPSSGGFGGEAEQGDATWISNFHAQSTWNTPGGDYANTPSAAAPAVLPGEVMRWSGAGMVADLRAWLRDPDTNAGWILIGQSSERQRVHRYHSSEAPNDTDRPRLVLEVIDADVQGDGRVNAIDVQETINGALELPLPPGVDPDVDENGRVDAADVQLVINGALWL